MPRFDPCPAALQSGRIASFSYGGELGEWLDVTGSYSLTNVNTIHQRLATMGRGVTGPIACLRWADADAWETQNEDLLRVGAAFTKCGVIYHERDDYATVGPGTTNWTYLIGSETVIRAYAERDSGGTKRFRLNVGETVANIAFGDFPFLEPVLMSVTSNGTDETKLWVHKISDSSEVGTATRAAIPGSHSVEYYGRPNLSAATGGNGSVTLIDNISIFDAALSGSDLQAIATHIRAQSEFIRAYTRAAEGAKAGAI